MEALLFVSLNFYVINIINVVIKKLVLFTRLYDMCSS